MSINFVDRRDENIMSCAPVKFVTGRDPVIAVEFYTTFVLHDRALKFNTGTGTVN